MTPDPRGMDGFFIHPDADVLDDAIIRIQRWPLCPWLRSCHTIPTAKPSTGNGQSITSS